MAMRCYDEGYEDLRGGADEYEIEEPGICPSCNEQTLFPAGSENYGTDADGNRGKMLYYYTCAECGHEFESF